MKSRVILLIAVVLVCMITSAILYSLFHQNPDDPIAPFKAKGKYIVDNYGRKVMMKGFHLDAGKMVNPPKGYRGTGVYSREEIQRIKNYGFHFVYCTIWWGNTEDNNTGAYDLNYLYRYSDYVDMCSEIGLYWIFRFRVSYNDYDPPSWQGWGRHWYVCTDEGLQRYCNFLEWAVQKLEERYDNIVGYQLWQFPFHQTMPTAEQRTFYYDSVLQAMVTSARKHTNKLLMVSSMHCRPEEFENMKKVDDDNISYGFCYYKPQIHGSDPYEPVWEGTQEDIDYQWNTLENAVNFMNSYDVPLHVVEFGIRLDREDQINKLKLKLQIFDHYGLGWCYWVYTWAAANTCFCLFHSDGIPKQGIVDALLNYNEWRMK